MTGTEQFLLPVLGVFALAWLGLALYVLLIRVAHEAQAAVLRTAQRVVVRSGTLEPPSLARVMRRLPRRVLERAVGDPTTPPGLARLFAEYLMHRHSGSIVYEAQRRTRRLRWRRVRALQIVTRARWEIAVPLLREAIASDDEEVAAAAVSLLGEVGDVRAAHVLVEALRTGSFARSRLASQLEVLREPAPHLFLPLLGDGDPQVRYWGTALLGRYAGHAGIDRALERALDDESPSVRAAAVESLAARRSPGAQPAAVALLGDPVWFVRAHAARALRDLDAAAGRMIAPLLADDSWWVRAAAKEALESRPAVSLETLLPYLEHEDDFARNGAAEVLQNTGVLDSLLAAGDDPPPTVQKILSAGGRRLRKTAAARNGLDPEYLEQLAAPGR